MSDTGYLPTPGSDDSWQLTTDVAGLTFELTVTEAILRQEVLDQTEVKKPARKAILRTSAKRLAKARKTGLPKVGTEARQALDWDAFITLVDKVIDNRHLSIRDNPQLAAEIAQDPRFGAKPRADSASDA